jgi:hypothetical protein
LGCSKIWIGGVKNEKGFDQSGRSSKAPMEFVRELVRLGKGTSDESGLVVITRCYRCQFPSSFLMICVSTQEPFPGETKVGFFKAIADLKRYLA